jgi:hypothetical protein
MDYICFKRKIDIKEFGEKLLNITLYSDDYSANATDVGEERD